LGTVCAASIAAILWRTGGTFVYTLDDAYIHLALAEELARGHYGVNPGSFSAPSSSVLWPFLLVPWARLQGAMLVPLFYNLLAAAGTVVVYRQVLVKVLRPSGATKQSIVVGLAGVGLALATNLAGLVLTGMEHSLQLLLVALAVLWLWEENETGEVSLWLVAALVLGPLVRYENLALTVPALVYVFSRGHRRMALGAGIALSVLLGAFSLFLLEHGVGPLPSSVLAKSSLDDGVGALLHRVWENLRVGQGRVLAAGLLPLLVVALSKKRNQSVRRIALVLIAAATLHFIGGRFGWQSRYEIYAWAAVLLGLLLLYGGDLRRFVDLEPLWKPTLLIAAAVWALGLQYVKNQVYLPFAAQNIYEQQFQMHRLLADYYPKPVAVNDLGLTAFRNEQHVLDLLGLGSHQALDLYITEPDSEWITRLADANSVRLAMVYDEWFPSLPTPWVLLGVLHRDGLMVSTANNEVFMYARDKASAEMARPSLHAWAATLPPKVRFELEPQP